jgi:ABC-type branched-subunit amino acid transport system substrate-binding protein
MTDAAVRLGIDFGTSSTVACMSRPDGRAAPLLFGDSPVLPSAVCLDPSGTLLVGRDAIYASRLRPEAYEPNPKRRIDDGSVLLGDRELAVGDLIAAVLHRVADEARRIAGRAPDATVLSCPAGWGARRRSVLRAAAAAAGLQGVSLVAEPVAAARYFVEVLGNDVPVGRSVVVYDFGAGTFDVSVVRRTADGFAVLAEEGLRDAGGLDVDAAVVGYLGAVLAGRDPQRWADLMQPTTAAQRRANRQLWDDVRTSKELLSRATATMVHIPLFDVDTPLGREQLEQLARPVLDRTVAATRVAIQESGVGAGQLAGVFLVGGSSRIPLVATLLHRALGGPPVAIEQPELVVAEGALRTPADGGAAEDPPTPVPPMVPPRIRAVASVPVSSPPVSGPPGSVPPVSVPPVSAPPVSPAPVSSPPASPTPVSVPPDLSIPVSVPPVAPAAPPVAAPDPPAPPAPPARSRRGLLLAVLAAIALAVVAGTAAVVFKLRGDGGDGGGAAGSGNSADRPCDRRIGLLGPLTGANAVVTGPIRIAVQVAVEEYNDAHREGGKVCVSTVDTGDAATAPAAAVALEQDESVIGLVGPLLSTEVAQFGDGFEAYGLPFVTPTAGDPTLQRKGWKTFHRTATVDTLLAVGAARLARDDLATKPFLLVRPDPFGRSMAAALRDSEVVEVAGSVEIEDTKASYDAAEAQIRSSGAGAIYYAGSLADSKPVIEALRAAGFKGPVIASDRFFDAVAASNLLGAANAPVYVTCSCKPSDAYYSDAATALTETLRNRFHIESNGYVPVAYDTAQILLAGLAGGAKTRAAMSEYLLGARYEGFGGTYRFVDGDRPADDVEVGLYKLSETGVFAYDKAT